MTLAKLEENFALPGVLSFEAHGELLRALVTLPTCSATIYLQGAHLTHWQPANATAPVFFLSERSNFVPGKAIRGGIPICFPWFGPRTPEIFGPAPEGQPNPAHGFARIQPWELAFAALMPGDDATLHLTWTLGSTELSRSLGFDNFRIACEMRLGRVLEVRLTVANTGSAPFKFEEALHSYFAVGDVRTTSLAGLEEAHYLDKRDGGAVKQASESALQLTRWTDLVFAGNTSDMTIEDANNQRTLRIGKQHSATTVVWNPWIEGSAPLADLPPDAWPGLLCVEAANTAADHITLLPGETHTMILKVECTPQT